MSSPTPPKRSPEVATDSILEEPMNQEAIRISDFTQGNKVWEQQILESMDHDDDEPLIPGMPIFLAWNVVTSEEFYNKAVSYGEEGGVVLPPAPIFNGAHPVGGATPVNLQKMQFNILTYLAASNPGASVIGGNIEYCNFGLACTLHQFAVALCQMCRLEQQAWFRAVLSHGEKLSGPLATLWIIYPNDDSGRCDTIPTSCELWK